MRGKEEKMTANISYIWAADQTEPGLSGVIYAATNTPTAPAATKAVAAAEGLVYGESLYSGWRMVGTAKGAAFRNDYGYFIELDTPANAGAPMEVEEVVRMNWYTKA